MLHALLTLFIHSSSIHPFVRLFVHSIIRSFTPTALPRTELDSPALIPCIITHDQGTEADMAFESHTPDIR